MRALIAAQAPRVVITLPFYTTFWFIIWRYYYYLTATVSIIRSSLARVYRAIFTLVTLRYLSSLNLFIGLLRLVALLSFMLHRL
ncbi:hypothetical protein V2W45_1422757 [Cenococcum geophilum]